MLTCHSFPCIRDREKSVPTQVEPIPQGLSVESPDQDTPLLSSSSLNAIAPSHSRAASVHTRRVSTSGFRRPSITGADILRSGTKSPLSPTDLPDIYRKQAATISELTGAVERLEGEVESLRGEERRLSDAAVKRDEAMEKLAVIRTELKEAFERSEIAVKERSEHEQEAEKLVSISYARKPKL